MKRLLYKYLPLTIIKIRIARMLYWLTKLFYRKDKRQIEREGISYEIDLKEGIELSLFLFGNFQKHVTKARRFFDLRDNPVIMDVGANSGLMSLPFAAWPGQPTVYAFEPTHYAYARLQRNLELNPGLAKRIKTIQSFVSEKTTENADIQAFSSWDISGKEKGEKHPVHRGTAKGTDGVGSVSLDQFAENQGLSHIDFIKVDTDGHEFEVFNGAKEAIAKYRPVIIFEVGQYVMKEKGFNFEFYLDYFGDLNYQLLDSSSGKELTLENWQKRIPVRGTIDVLALPDRYQKNK